ncbi:hypothetical protein LPJ64_006426, partial [Coemansia asiatica]
MAYDVNSVKMPLRTIGWKGKYLERLKVLVKQSHSWIAHGYLFARYILLRELHAQPPDARDLVVGYVNDYMETVSMNKVFSIKAASSLTRYQAEMMLTAFENSVKNNFGCMLEHVVIALTRSHEHAEAIKMHVHGQPDAAKKQACNIE